MAIQKNEEVDMAIEIKMTRSKGRRKNRDPKGIKEMVASLLSFAGYEDGEFECRVAGHLKGSPHFQGLAGLRVVKGHAHDVELKVQPGGCDSAYKCYLKPPHEVDASSFLGDLRAAVDLIQEDVEATPDELSRALPAFLKLHKMLGGGKPFALAYLSDDRAKKCGFADRHEACALVKAAGSEGRFVAPAQEQDTFLWIDGFGAKDSENTAPPAPENVSARIAELKARLADNTRKIGEEEKNSAQLEEAHKDAEQKLTDASKEHAEAEKLLEEAREMLTRATRGKGSAQRAFSRARRQAMSSQERIERLKERVSKIEEELAELDSEAIDAEIERLKGALSDEQIAALISKLQQ